MKKPICIYHGNCADGFGAAWVFNRWGGHAFDFHAGVYQEPPPDVDGRDVYLVDFSYKREVVEQIRERANRVVLIDHHKTAIEDLQPLIDSGVIDALTSLGHSGAVLAWEWCFDGEPPALLRHIEDRDLWRFVLPYTREIQACVFSHPYDFTVWDGLVERADTEAGLAGLIREGQAIERKHHKDVDELLGVTMRQMEIGGHVVPVANLPYTLVSDAAHIMAKGAPFAACYWDTPAGRVFGLRSAEDGLDVSEIAKGYGGGGHRHSAGFRVPYGHALAS